jgi:chromosome partitioning protein
MGKILAVVNQKGGVGKTTTAVNVATYMALEGVQVLLVDLDPQGNATSGLGVDRGTIEASIYDVLVEGTPLDTVVLPTQVSGLSILPSTLDLAGAELQLMSMFSRETLLKQALTKSENQYDIILIDAPPSLGLLTLNALVAATAILIPMQTEYYALEGISQLLRTVDLVKRQLNPTLEIERVVLTMHDERTRLAKQVVEEIQNYFGDLVSPTIVPRNVRLSESPSHGLPIALYDPRSRGAIAYKSIAKEVLQNGKTGSR